MDKRSRKQASKEEVSQQRSVAVGEVLVEVGAELRELMVKGGWPSPPRCSQRRSPSSAARAMGAEKGGRAGGAPDKARWCSEGGG